MNRAGYTLGRYNDIFADTPKMSTYLLAFIVSNYDFTENTAQNFGVYARPEMKAQTTYARDFGVDMLARLGGYFEIDYYSVASVNKMDMAAIPDFSAGAMEVSTCDLSKS